MRSTRIRFILDGKPILFAIAAIHIILDLLVISKYCKFFLRHIYCYIFHGIRCTCNANYREQDFTHSATQYSSGTCGGSLQLFMCYCMKELPRYVLKRDVGLKIADEN